MFDHTTQGKKIDPSVRLELGSAETRDPGFGLASGRRYENQNDSCPEAVFVGLAVYCAIPGCSQR